MYAHNSHFEKDEKKVDGWTRETRWKYKSTELVMQINIIIK